ncbi:MAG: hypothetical protein A3J93_02725 [Candidatus Magasanikbacteria bacterium RIFOXYC2_FULL_42_28]|uniref:Uncharacterized protein n=1 Tax=Candidatus Magasanikbacteria bacterium RIFOXYC2_FULL_42_28 TaxID=1798704 RepID=A0A1F6NW68_9BACT|nr:MAG: hypothetical protein A3J93_02725 [Candidatus Magasanikbacteria bacterium RIFOXYC2_FULL_42_28]
MVQGLFAPTTPPMEKSIYVVAHQQSTGGQKGRGLRGGIFARPFARSANLFAEGVVVCANFDSASQY